MSAFTCFALGVLAGFGLRALLTKIFWGVTSDEARERLLKHFKNNPITITTLHKGYEWVKPGDVGVIEWPSLGAYRTVEREVKAIYPFRVPMTTELYRG